MCMIMGGAPGCRQPGVMFRGFHLACPAGGPAVPSSGYSELSRSVVISCDNCGFGLIVGRALPGLFCAFYYRRRSCVCPSIGGAVGCCPRVRTAYSGSMCLPKQDCETRAYLAKVMARYKPYRPKDEGRLAPAPSLAGLVVIRTCRSRRTSLRLRPCRTTVRSAADRAG